MPSRPTLPLLHGWVPAHWMQSRMSIVSRGLQGSRKPGDRPHPAGVDPHADIAVGHPLLRIADLPRLEAVRRARRHFRAALDHRLPRVGITVLERQILAVRAVTQYHGMRQAIVRAKNVGAQHHTIVHLDRHIPLDYHAEAGNRHGVYLATDHRLHGAEPTEGAQTRSTVCSFDVEPYGTHYRSLTTTLPLAVRSSSDAIASAARSSG